MDSDYKKIVKDQKFRDDLLNRLRKSNKEQNQSRNQEGKIPSVLKSQEVNPNIPIDSIDSPIKTDPSLDFSDDPNTKYDYSPPFYIAALLHSFTKSQLSKILKDNDYPSSYKNWTFNKDDELTEILDVCDFKFSLELNDIEWSMLPEERQKVFASLDENGEGLKDYISILENTADKTEQMLYALLTGQTHDVKSYNKNELAILSTIITWVGSYVEKVPEMHDIVQRQRFLEIIEPLYNLTTHFKGRKKELKRIRAYVDYLGSEDLLESVSRGISRLFSFKNDPPLVITGIGGVGKSSLIAKFILDHVNHKDPAIHNKDELIFVFIDFDHGRVSIREPLGILKEFISQLSIRFPKFERQWISLSDEINDFIRIGRSKSIRNKGQDLIRQNVKIASTSSQFEQVDFLNRVGELYELSLGKRHTPILLVLDSFEEVQRLGDPVMISFFEFFQEWMNKLPFTRLVIAGRAKISERIIETSEIELEGFDKEAAMGYLEAKGVKDPETIDFLIQNFELYPLTLILAIEVLRKNDFDKSSLTDISDRAYINSKIKKAKTQQILFNRNLDHIKYPKAQQIAFPGMVVRKISKEVIKEVLAAPCGLGPIDVNQAKKIFDLLAKEKFLIESISQEKVRFRKDLRQLILPLVVEESKGKALQIHNNAVAYYKNMDDDESTAEYIYHRLCRNDDPHEVIKHLDKEKHERYLSMSLDELPNKAHIIIATAFDIPVPDTIRLSADNEDWEANMIEQIKEALDNKYRLSTLTSIYNSLKERKQRITNSHLFLWESWLQFKLGNIKECKKSLRNAKEIDVSDAAHIKKEILLLESKVYDFEGEYFLAIHSVKGLFTHLVDQKIWSKESIIWLRTLVRLYFRVLHNENDAEEAHHIFYSFVLAFPNVILSNIEVNILIYQVLTPFLTHTKGNIDKLGLLEVYKINWIDPSLDSILETDKKGSKAVPIYKVELDQLSENIIKRTVNSNYVTFSTATAFQNKKKTLRKKVKNMRQLEELAAEILGGPLRNFVEPSHFEISLVDFLDTVEYQNRSLSLDLYFDHGLVKVDKDIQQESHWESIDSRPILEKEAPGSEDQVENNQEIPPDNIEKPQSKEDLINIIRKLIAENKLQQALSELQKNNAENQDFQNTIIVLKGRLTRLENDNMMGILTREDYNIQYNRIIRSLLYYTEEMEF